jgi:molybdopterin biosynthesis enzyme
MERHVQRLTSPNASRRARLWLAAANGRTLQRPVVAPIDGPELTMAVRFEGLTDAEQRVALAAFPGGRRFVLAS